MLVRFGLMFERRDECDARRAASEPVPAKGKQTKNKNRLFIYSLVSFDRYRFSNAERNAIYVFDFVKLNARVRSIWTGDKYQDRTTFLTEVL